MHKTFLHQGCAAGRQDGVALHFADAHGAPAFAVAPGEGLAGVALASTDRPCLDLVLHRVLEELVEALADVDVRYELFTCGAVDHALLACGCKPVVDHLPAELGVECVEAVLATQAERRSVVELALECSHAPCDELDHLAHGHARGNRVGVDEEVGGDPRPHLERHVDFLGDHADGALLGAAGRELVTHLRTSDVAHLDAHEPLVVLGHADEHLVHDAALVLGQIHRVVFLNLMSPYEGHPHFSDDAVPGAEDGTDLGRPVRENVAVAGRRFALAEFHGWQLDHVRHCAHLLLHDLVRRVLGVHEQASVDRRLLDHKGVFLVVGVCEDGHGNGDAWGGTGESDHAVDLGFKQGACRVRQDARLGIEPIGVVFVVYAYGLLAHARLEDIARSLIVVGERDDRGADAEHGGGIKLAMRVRLALGGLFQHQRCGSLWRGWEQVRDKLSDKDAL